MGSHRFWRIFGAGLFALAVAGCGGGGADGSGFGSGDGTGTGGGSGGGGGGGDGTGTVTPVPRLGVLDGDSFTPGVIEVGVSPLAAGGSSGLRVNIVDTANSNALITDSVNVTFSSPCASGGSAALAVIDPAVVTTTTGTANTTYRAQGCSGTEQITATATVGGTVLQASGSIQVQPASLGSIEFVSANPTTIGLRGSGQPEISTVTFRVRNASGGPVPNQVVNFSLNTSAGGIEMSGNPGTTDSTGLVSVTVRAGTVHTSVRVTATATQGGNTISSQSENLTISTGIPDQDSISISATTFNVEGLNYDGLEVGINVRAADRYNNPVPDGTAIALTTEGGRIDGDCITLAGLCSVKWVSQNPRPPAAGGSGAGRSTVLAYAIGEESFTDADGDGLYDPGEPFTDLPEAFLDKDEDGVRDTATHVEEFIDFNSNAAYDPADARFNGLLCDDGTGTLTPCPEPRTVHVRDSLVIIMSGSEPIYDASDVTAEGAGVTFDPATGTITIPNGGRARISVVVRDVNDQPMPAGTAVAFTEFGEGAFFGTTTFRVPNTIDDSAAANTYSVSFKGPTLKVGDPEDETLVEIKVTTPIVSTGPEPTATTLTLRVVTTPPSGP